MASSDPLASPVITVQDFLRESAETWALAAVRVCFVVFSTDAPRRQRHFFTVTAAVTTTATTIRY